MSPPFLQTAQQPALAIYVSRDGQSFGPYSWEELWGHYQAGTVVGTDLAWHERQPDWQPVEQLFAPDPNPVPKPNLVPEGPVTGVGGAEIKSLADPSALNHQSPKAPDKKEVDRKVEKKPNKQSVEEIVGKHKFVSLGLAGIILLGSVVWFFLLRNTDVPLDQLVKDSNGLVCLSTSFEPFDGVGISEYPSGQMQARIEFDGGKENGKYQLWHENGQLMHEAEYFDGKYSGASKWWTKDGKLAIESRFRDGEEKSTTEHSSFEIPFDAIPVIRPRPGS